MHKRQKFTRKQAIAALARRGILGPHFIHIHQILNLGLLLSSTDLLTDSPDDRHAYD